MLTRVRSPDAGFVYDMVEICRHEREKRPSVALPSMDLLLEEVMPS